MTLNDKIFYQFFIALIKENDDIEETKQLFEFFD